MDKEMILLDNLMPVEVAIKRELEYRRKVETLRKQHQTDFEKDSWHSKGPLRSLSGTKRKAPPTSSQGFSSLQHYQSHEAFQKHPAGLVCTVCEAAFSTLYYLKQHCASHAHRNKLLETKKGRNALSNPLRCGLCNVPCSSEVVLEGHLSGAKHAASLLELESAKLGREGEAGLQLFNEKHWN